jgi:hypothetical protein
MKIILEKTFKDLCMFCVGFVSGVLVDYVIDSLHITWDPTLKSKKPKIVLGLLQIFINGCLLRTIEMSTFDRGLFSLGLFGSQSLLINTVYISPRKLRQTSS